MTLYYLILKDHWIISGGIFDKENIEAKIKELEDISLKDNFWKDKNLVKKTVKQKKIFEEVLKIPAVVVKSRFGYMLESFEYGAPPHGGIAPGIDRIVMLLAKEENLREVTMFPMNQQAEDLLMGAPSNVSLAPLKELSIRTIEKK